MRGAYASERILEDEAVARGDSESGGGEKEDAQRDDDKSFAEHPAQIRIQAGQDFVGVKGREIDVEKAGVVDALTAFIPDLLQDAQVLLRRAPLPGVGVNSTQEFGDLLGRK